MTLDDEIRILAIHCCTRIYDDNGLSQEVDRRRIDLLDSLDNLDKAIGVLLSYGIACLRKERGTDITTVYQIAHNAGDM